MEKKEEKVEKEQGYTEQYAGIIMLRKGRLIEKDVWFGTVGNQMVSDQVYDSKEELIENLNNITIERICKIATGVFGRVVEMVKDNKR